MSHLENRLARFLAKHHVPLRKIFQNTNFVRTNFDSFNRFRIRLCDFFFHSFALYECIRGDFSVAEMSIHIHVRSGMPQFPGGEVRFCGVVPERRVLQPDPPFLSHVSRG